MSKVFEYAVPSARQSRSPPVSTNRVSSEWLHSQRSRIREALSSPADTGMVLQRRPAEAGASRSQADASLVERIQAQSARGARLPETVRSTLEAGLGQGLSSVRLHVDSEADRLAREVDAVAFTTGDHVFFRAGAYEPGSREGMRLLAHEVAHTTQRVAATDAGRGGVRLSQSSEPLERAADQSASAILRAEAPESLGAGVGPAASPARPVNGPLLIQRRELANGISVTEPGDWTTSDRENNTPRWQAACEHNLLNADSSQYRQVVERRDFYRWFYEYTASKGYTTRWALAAYVVANGAYELSHMPSVEWAATQMGAVNNQLQGMMREGNQVIFDDVLPKLRDLVLGGPLAGPAALQWDMEVLSEEQALIQPLYAGISPQTFTMLDNAARQYWLAQVGAIRIGQNANQVAAGPYNKGGTVMGFSGSDLMNVDERWHYGMSLGSAFSPTPTGYTPGMARPTPRPEYTSGVALSKVDKRPNLHQLDAQFDYRGVPGTLDAAEVKSILARLSGHEQRELLGNKMPGNWMGYQHNLLRALSWSDYRDAIVGFRVDLVRQMQWLEANAGDRALHWRLIDYNEIRPMILAFSQTERNRLHTPAWKEVFIWVCDDTTIVQAVADLGLAPAAAKAWIDEERN